MASMEELQGAPLEFSTPFMNRTVQVVEFVGNVNQSETTLYTLDVCPSDDFQAVFVANYFLTNITAFQPGTVDYYLQYVLPRVLPWAVSFLALGLAFFLSFCIWRSIRCCCEACCPSTGCGCCCKPSVTPQEALSGYWYRFLQVIITILLVGVIAISIWGCFVAGPQVLEKFWITVDEILNFAYWLTSVGDNAVGRVGDILSTGKDLVAFLQDKINPSDIEKILDCVTDFLNKLPNAAGQLIGLFEQIVTELEGIPAAIAASVASLQTLKADYLPGLTAAASEVAKGSSFHQQLLNQTDASLVAYGALPSSSVDAQAPVQAVLDANAALDIPGKVEQAEDISAAVLQLGEAVASPVLGYVSGNVSALLVLLGTLKNDMLPTAKQTAQEVSTMVSGAVGCVQEAIEKAEAINNTVIQLPAESSTALNGARGQLQLLNSTGILNNLGPILDELEVPPAAQALGGKVEALRDALSFISPDNLDATSRYLEGVTGALGAAAEPVAINTDDGVAFVAVGDELSYTRFDVSKPAAVEALSVLEAATLASPQVALSTFTKAAAAVRILRGLSVSEIDDVLENLEEKLSDERLAELQGMRENISSALRDAKEAVGVDVAGGVEKMTDFIEQVQAAMGSVNDTLKVLDGELSAALRDAKELLLETNETVMDVDKLLDTAKLYADTANYARVYLSYFIFIVSIVSSVMVIVGVWMAIPFLYNFFTAVLLLMLVFLFILFIPYGSVVTVGSDTCHLMESKVQDSIDFLPDLDTKTKVALRGALDYYIYGAVYGSVWELLKDITDVDVQQILGEVQGYKAQIARELAKLKLQGDASAKMEGIFGAVDNAVRLVTEVVDSVSQPYINAMYVGLKSLVCCQVIGTSGLQWLAMFLSGCLICAAACFIYAFVARLDGLPPKDVCCRTCGCYQHKSTDKAVLSNQFMMEGDGDEYNIEMTPTMNRQI